MYGFLTCESDERMYSHVTLGSNDMSASVAFYDAVLAELGIEGFPEHG